MKKTVSYDGQEYVLATITAGVGKSISFVEETGKQLPPKEFNFRIVVASLMSGGMAEGADAFTADLPLFGTYGEFLDAALDVNGLKVTEGKKEAVASPAQE